MYKIKLEVYDNTDEKIKEDSISLDSTNLSVSDIKSIINPGTYTNIKSEIFIANEGRTDLANDDIVNPFFVKYRIDLN